MKTSFLCYLMFWLVVSQTIDQSISQSNTQSSTILNSQYTILGPDIISPSGVNAVLQSINRLTNQSIGTPLAGLISQANNQSTNQTINIGVLLSLSGPNSMNTALDAGVLSFLQFLIDLINMFGGIAINPSSNLPSDYYRLRLIVADDQSSTHLAEITALSMMDNATISQAINQSNNQSSSDSTDQSIHILMGTVGESVSFAVTNQLIDQDVSIITSSVYNPSVYQSLNRSINQSNCLALNQSNYQSNNQSVSQFNRTNLFGITVTSTLVHLKTLQSINQQAINFAISQSTEICINNYNQSIECSKDHLPYSATGYISPFGLSRVCLFAPNDDQSINLIKPIRQWVSEENLRRVQNGAIDLSIYQSNNQSTFDYVNAYASYIRSVNSTLASPSLSDAETIKQSINQLIDQDLIKLSEYTIKPYPLTAVDYQNYFSTCEDLSDLLIVPYYTEAAIGLINQSTNAAADQLDDQSNRLSRFKSVLALAVLDLTVDQAIQQAINRDGMNQNSNIESNDQFISADGWIVSLPFPLVIRSNLPSPLDLPINQSSNPLEDVSVNQMTQILTYYQIYTNQSTSQSISPSFISRLSEFSVILAAINQTIGVSRSDFRDALLSLNGYSTWLGKLAINSDTGENLPIDLSVYPSSDQLLHSDATTVVQLINGRVVIFDPANVNSIQYPYPLFYSTPIQYQVMESSQSLTAVLAGAITVVIAAWVGQILFEQLLDRSGNQSNNPTHKYSYLFWLILSCAAIGGVGICTVHSANALALSIRTPPDQSNNQLELDIHWSFGMLAVSWITVFSIMFIALLLLVQPANDVQVRPTVDHRRAKSLFNQPSNHSTQQSVKRGSERKKSIVSMADRKSMLTTREQAQNRTWREELIHLLRCSIQWRCVLSGFIMTAAVTLSRWLVVKSIQTKAVIHSGVEVWIGTAILCAICLPCIATVFRNGRKWRIPAVFLFACVIMLDWQIHAVTQQVLYEPAPEWMSGGALYDVSLNSDTFTVFNGLIAAGLCFIFVGIQFVSMRLSHAGLLEAMNAMQQLVDKANERIESVEKSNKERLDLVVTQARAIEEAEALAQPLRQSISQQSRHINLMSQTLDSVLLAVSIPEEFVLPLAVFGYSSQSAGSVPSGHDSKDSKGNGVATLFRSKASETPGSVRRDLSFGSKVAIAPTPDQQPVSKRRMAKEAAAIAALEAQAAAPKTDEIFSLDRPLLGEQIVLNSSSEAIYDYLPTYKLNVQDVLCHPSCLELFKQHVAKSHSSENIAFYMLARKYRSIHSGTLRQLVATEIVEIFIREGADQQINLSTSQRQPIMETLNQSINQSNNQSDESFPQEMFMEAEKEVLSLIETNTFESFCKTADYRLCCWLYAAIDAKGVTPEWLQDNEE